MSNAAKSLLVIGGTSDVGRATAGAFARDGWAIRLAGRDEAGLAREAADIATRFGGAVSTHHLDVLETPTFAAFADALPELPDVVVCVVGILGDQRRAETDLDHAALVMRSNFEGPAQILAVFAERLAMRGSGAIVGVSSVAGDRGRGSNYVYGSAKAGFSAFLSGLRNRLMKNGVRVLTVKPGFIRTKMIAHIQTPAVLTASPEEVATAIRNGVGRGRDVIYVKPIWRLVMTVICGIPERIFKRLSL
jgi:short-subunit dehydrogenase